MVATGLAVRRIVSLAIVASLLVASAPQVASSSDTTPPDLLALSLSPATVNAGGPDPTISLTFHVVDASGFSSYGVFLRSPSGGGSGYGGGASAIRISGNSLDGIYRLTESIGGEVGTWSVDRVVATDSVGNVREWNEVQLAAAGFPTTFEVIYDDTFPPTATITRPATPTSASTLHYTLLFSEGVTGLAASDFAVSGTATSCVVGTPGGSGDSYAVDLTGCSEGTVILALTANSVTDPGGNAGPASTTTAQPVTIDTTPPDLLALSLSPATVNAGGPDPTISLTFHVVDASGFSSYGVFLRSPSGGGSGYGGGASAIRISGNSLDGIYRLTESIGGEVGTWSVDRVVATDSVGNVREWNEVQLAAAGFPTTFEVIYDDTFPPTATITRPATPTSAVTLGFVVEFNEPVTGLTAADLGVTGTATDCTVEEPTGSLSSYAVDVTGCTDGSVTLVLAAGAVVDGFDNSGPISPVTANAVTVDTTPPNLVAMTISPSVVNTSSGPVDLAIALQFVDDLSGFKAGSVEARGPDSGGWGLGCGWPTGICSILGSISPNADAGIWTIWRVSGTDKANNRREWSDAQLAAAGFPSTFEIITTPAAVLTAPSSPTNSATLAFGLDFNETVTGLTVDDFSLSGSATGCTVDDPVGSGKSYVVTVRGCSGGTVVVSLAAESVANVASDRGPSAVVSAPAVAVDRTKPTAVLSAPSSPTADANLSYGLDFDEAISGLTTSDFTVSGDTTGCTVGVPTGAASSYVVVVSGCSEGAVILELATDSVADAAGNVGPATQVTAATVTIDRTIPTAILTAPSSPTNSATLAYALDFNETVTGLTVDDFSLSGSATGCTVDDPVGSGKSYVVTVRGCSGGTVVVSLAADTVVDAGNDSGPAGPVIAPSVTIDRSAPAGFFAAPSGPTNASALTYGLDFDEAIAGLTTSDFTVSGDATGCTVGAPTGAASSYVVVVSGCSEGAVILELATDSVADAAGNVGPATQVTAATVTIDRSAPSTSALIGPPHAGMALEGSSVPLALSWYGADDPGGSGVARYELERSVNSGPWASVSTVITIRTASVLVASSGTTRYRVRAVDAADNKGGWAYTETLSLRLTQQSSSAVNYGGTWTKTSSSKYSGGSVKYAKVAGRSAMYTFTGRSIALVTTRAPSRGKVKVYINGVYQGKVDLYRSSTQYRVLAWQKKWSTTGTRTIKLVVVGTSGRPRVDLDAFVVVK